MAGLPPVTCIPTAVRSLTKPARPPALPGFGVAVTRTPRGAARSIGILLQVGSFAPASSVIIPGRGAETSGDSRALHQPGADEVRVAARNLLRHANERAEDVKCREVRPRFLQQRRNSGDQGRGHASARETSLGTR